MDLCQKIAFEAVERNSVRLLYGQWELLNFPLWWRKLVVVCIYVLGQFSPPELVVGAELGPWSVLLETMALHISLGPRQITYVQLSVDRLFYEFSL